MSKKDFVVKLKVETQELQEKLTALTEFMRSEDFGHLSEAERQFLQVQWYSMNTYFTMLHMRIALHT